MPSRKLTVLSLSLFVALGVDWPARLSPDVDRRVEGFAR